MQIVVDHAFDLSPEQLDGFPLHYVPMWVNLDGRSYSAGVELTSQGFYQLIKTSSHTPTTSMPTLKDFENVYKPLAALDDEILSIHVSSQLSGTYDAARLSAAALPAAHITVVDSRSVSVLYGWQVRMAALAATAGWSIPRILKLLEQVRRETIGNFTVLDMHHLIHSGRLGLLRSMLASMLNIKPIISVDQISGVLIGTGREMTFKRAIRKICEKVFERFPKSASLCLQIVHGDNLPGVKLLREQMAELLLQHRYPDPIWQPVLTIGPALGAHGGPTLIGLAAAPAELFIDAFADGLP
jgi:DegV family protein with EDD domain